MSVKTLGSALTRTLWAKGNRTAPGTRSPKGNSLSTTCRGLAKGKHGCENTKEQSCGSHTGRPSGDVLPFTEPPRAPAVGNMKPDEPVGAPGVSGVRGRSYFTNAAPMDQRTYLWARYHDMKRLVHGKLLVPLCPSRPPHGPPGVHVTVQTVLPLTPETFCSFRICRLSSLQVA